jgi:TolA-binding protein
LANQLFAQIYAADKSSIGAEAKYMTCEILYKQNQLKPCQDAIFDMVDALTNDYWITKGFLLLADTYIQENNLFQARATLESIIENHQGTELKTQAQNKLKTIDDLEKK